MGKKSEAIKQLLIDTGHWDYPFGKESQAITERAQLYKAIQSYQNLHSNDLAPLIAKHHPDRSSPEVRVDGVIGPALKQLMKRPRCACVDYDASYAEELQGSGNWKGCHGIGNFHSARVQFLNKPPSQLKPVMDRVWQRVVKTYSEMGLKFIKVTSKPNITVEFVKPNGSWIGLAIVGNNQRCNSKIWARFNRKYKPKNTINEWTTLFNHELGHNCGLRHSNGGIMNSYLVKGLEPTWWGDASERLLTHRFGGKPVESTPDTPDKPLPPTPPPTEDKLLASFNYGGETIDISVRSKSSTPGWMGLDA
jgi:hypothetical protein